MVVATMLQEVVAQDHLMVPRQVGVVPDPPMLSLLEYEARK